MVQSDTIGKTKCFNFWKQKSGIIELFDPISISNSMWSFFHIPSTSKNIQNQYIWAPGCLHTFLLF